MALKDLIQPRPVSEPDEKAEAVGSPPPPAAVEPVGVATSVTPSGIEIYYQAGPKRLYRIRDIQGVNVSDDDWIEVPSVSKINDELAAPGLTWWAMKIGVAGVLELLSQNAINTDDLSLVTDQDLVDLLTKNKLTVNHVRDKAGDRGTAVHDALEVWATTGKLAPPNIFNEDERGYVVGLNEFLTDSGAEAQVSEVMVASMEHLYAGRFDLGAVIPNGAEVVTKSYPKKPSKRERLEGGTWLLDLKTSKYVYKTAHLQLAAYDLAVRESYGTEYDHAGVIHVFPDGRYELVRCKATAEDWLTVRTVYDTMQRL